MIVRMLNHVYDGAPIKEQVDAYGIAPYIGISETLETIDKTNAQILAELRASIPGAMSNVAQHVATAGVMPVMAYEGGQHMVASGALKNNQALTDKLISVNSDPGIEAVYDEYLQAWRDNGGDLFMHFSSTSEPSKHGSWGAFEYFDGVSPKHNALVKYIDAVSLGV